MKISKWFDKKSDTEKNVPPRQETSGGEHGETAKDTLTRKNRQNTEQESTAVSLQAGMEKSRSGFMARMDSLLSFKREIDPQLLDELEEVLIMADMGVSTVQAIFERLRGDVKRKELKDPEALRKRIRQYLEEMLTLPDITAFDRKIESVSGPFVILVVGVNGVGKTTTIAKMAHLFKEQGRKVMIAAADTFRAAAIDQLQEWGHRLGVTIIHHQPGSDPSAVAFDAIEAGISRDMDVIIVDTAGRLHTQVNLMEELKKIKRVMGKKIPDAPHETLLVLDATTGQNAVSQAKLFKEATDLTGIVLTKLDGTAKGGITISIVHEMKIPIYFIGIGEKLNDLRPFDADQFVRALFD